MCVLVCYIKILFDMLEAGLPHGQENLRKLHKSGKNGSFLKKVRKNLFKSIRFFQLQLTISLY